MGFQVNGVEWVNNSGHFTQGLKTGQGNAMTGTGSMTTNTSAVGTFGTTRNSVGSIALGVATGTYTATAANIFGYLNQVGFTITGIPATGSAAGSNIWDLWSKNSSGAYPFYRANWRATAGYYSISSHLNSGTAGTDYIKNFSGTWTCISSGFERGTSYAPGNLFMRIS